MPAHIGKLIEKRLIKVGISKTEFARRINTSSQNVYGILKRKTIDTGLLQNISDVLEHNFFQHFISSNDVSLKKELEECREKLEAVKKENNHLTELNALLKENISLLKKKR